MKVKGIHRRSIVANPALQSVTAIDQRKLPFELSELVIGSWREMETAIREMAVRGAPLIGVSAAYGLWLACEEARASGGDENTVWEAAARLKATRPTAVNLAWAVERMLDFIHKEKSYIHPAGALAEAERIAAEDLAASLRIGENGLRILQELSAAKGGTLNILTHCNAGWLATVDYGTALAPVFLARERGLDIHVWVDETRPRNQGLLTAWELSENDIPHTYICDNAGGLLMRRGEVDVVITGADRVTICGDVANKVGTYLKALAAHDNGIPFYAAFPASTLDPRLREGMDTEVEDRGAEEVRFVHTAEGMKRILPDQSPVRNPGFDITPARLITGLITEKGVCGASEREICRLFPEWAPWAGA